jgi:hypothetical protein
MKLQIIPFLLVPLFAPLGLLQTAPPSNVNAPPHAWQRQVNWEPQAEASKSETVFSAFSKGMQVGATRVKVKVGASQFAIGMSMSL